MPGTGEAKKYPADTRPPGETGKLGSVIGKRALPRFPSDTNYMGWQFGVGYSITICFSVRLPTRSSGQKNPPSSTIRLIALLGGSEGRKCAMLSFSALLQPSLST